MPSDSRKQKWEEVAREVKEAQNAGTHKTMCRCLPNALLAGFFRALREHVMEEGAGDSMFPMTLFKAAKSVEACGNPICTSQELRQLKHIGKALVEIVEGALWSQYPPPRFISGEDPAQAPLQVGGKRALGGGNEDAGEGRKRQKSYCPTHGSANYAFLVLLYKSLLDGEPHLGKEELMRRTDISGLSNKSVYGEKDSLGSQFTSKSFYNGWSSFKVLRKQDPPLVVVWSNPMKIKISESGIDLGKKLYEDAVKRGKIEPSERENVPAPLDCHTSNEGTSEGILNPVECAQVMQTPEQIRADVVMIDLVEDAPQGNPESKHTGTVNQSNASRFREYISPLPEKLSRSGKVSHCEWQLPLLGKDPLSYTPRLPPLSPGEKFKDAYEIVLLVDQREQFSRAHKGSQRINESSNEHLDRLRAKKVNAEHRVLEQGDAVWIARSRKTPDTEYVLDYIIERKSFHDLIQSIRSKRYEQQKYWITRSGLRHKIYLVEGDVDSISDGKAARTACITTQIIDGFYMMRTRNVSDTLETYAHLTKAMINFFDPLTSIGSPPSQERPLMLFREFQQRLGEMKKLTVQDVWGMILMSVQGVGAELATGILAEFPVPISLFKHYKKTISEAKEKGLDAISAAQSALAKVQTPSLRLVGQSASTAIFDSLFRVQWAFLDQ